MMRGRLLRWGLLLAVAAGAAGAAPIGGTSFETGTRGWRWRAAAGPAGEQPGAPELVRTEPGDGAWCLRWRLPVEATDHGLELPRLALAAGEPLNFSLLLRSEPEGLPVRLDILDSAGARLATAGYALSAGWRRYELAWTPAEDTVALVRVTADPPVRTTTWWVDDLRLSEGATPDPLPAPELTVQLRRQAVRWAGQGAAFDVRLRSPVAQEEVAYQWRLERTDGSVERRGAGLLRPDEAIGAARAVLNVGTLAPGAWRAVVEVVVARRQLWASDSLVVVEPELADPPTWVGTEGIAAADAVGDLVALRVGLLRAIGGAETPAVPTRPAYAAARRARHDGLDTVAYWPADEAGLGAWGAVVSWWEPLAGELWTSVEADGERLRARHAAAGRRGRWCGVRLMADDQALPQLRAIAAADLLAATDAVQLVLPTDAAPEAIEALPWAELRAVVGERRLWLVLPAWAAAGWNEPAAGGLAAPRQAAYLARALLLGRWAGLDAVLYPGGAVYLDPARAELSALGPRVDLRDAWGRPQPGLAALSWIGGALRGRQVEERLEPAPGVRLLRLAGRRPLLALWATGEAPVTVELDLGAHEVIPRGPGGTPLSLTGAPLRLTLGPAPVLLEARVRAYDRLVAAAGTVRVVGAE